MNSNRKLVSVVIPTYNRSAFICETIKSIATQSYSPTEIIVVDDGSTDDTEDLVRSLSIRNLKYIKTENYGVSSAFNRGVLESNGCFIARSDSDDISVRNRLEMQVAFLSNNKIDVVGSSLSLFGTCSELWKYPTTHEEIISHSIFSVPVGQPSVMLKSHVFQSNLYNESINIAEDYEFWARILVKGYKFANINEPLVRYRCHSNQLSISSSANEIKQLVCQEYLNLMFGIPKGKAELYSKFVNNGIGDSEIINAFTETVLPKLSESGKYVFKKNIVRLIVKYQKSLISNQLLLDGKAQNLLNLSNLERFAINSGVLNVLAKHNSIKKFMKYFFSR